MGLKASDVPSGPSTAMRSAVMVPEIRSLQVTTSMKSLMPGVSPGFPLMIGLIAVRLALKIPLCVPAKNPACTQRSRIERTLFAEAELKLAADAIKREISGTVRGILD